MTEFRLPKRDRSPGLTPSPRTDEPEYPALTGLVVQVAALRGCVEKLEAERDAAIARAEKAEASAAEDFKLRAAADAKADSDADYIRVLEGRNGHLAERVEKAEARAEMLAEFAPNRGPLLDLLKRMAAQLGMSEAEILADPERAASVATALVAAFWNAVALGTDITKAEALEDPDAAVEALLDRAAQAEEHRDRALAWIIDAHGTEHTAWCAAVQDRPRACDCGLGAALAAKATRRE